MVCLSLLLLALLIFGQGIRHQFIVCDDDPYIYNNPMIAQGITQDCLSWAFTSSYAGNWHPLTWLSHAFDVQWYGLHPGGHHLTSLLLHAAGAIVLFLALRQMTGAFWRSALVAAMFAAHPLRVESVAWAAERKDVLSGLFWMLTLLAYGWYARRPGIGRYLGVMAALALGLMSKSMLVTLPCVLLLLDFWPLRRWPAPAIAAAAAPASPPACAPCPPGRLLIEKLPLLAMSAAVSAAVALNQFGAGYMSMVDRVPLGIRFANAATSTIGYLWKTLWPFDLAIFYPHPWVVGKVGATRLIWEGVAAAILLAAVTLVAYRNQRRRPYLAVGWLWYLGALVPVSGLVQIGAQAMADRYTYLPTVGIYLMVVWGAAESTARRPRLRQATAVAAVAVLAVWCLLAARQTATWRDSYTVFEHAIEATSDNYFAENHLGLAYYLDRRFDEAGIHFAEAVRLGPRYDSANSNLGLYYSIKGRNEEAEEYFRKAVAINPFLPAYRLNLALVLARQGKLREALDQRRAAQRANPDNVGVLPNPPPAPPVPRPAR